MLFAKLCILQPQIKQTFEPELLAILHFMYRLTVLESGATYGAQLQNLKYRNERQHWGGCVKLNILYKQLIVNILNDRIDLIRVI
jgi:hypothetical protein